MYNCLTSDLDLLLPIAYYRIIDVNKRLFFFIEFYTDFENPFAIYHRLSFSYENSIFNAKLIRLTEYIVKRIADRR